MSNDLMERAAMVANRWAVIDPDGGEVIRELVDALSGRQEEGWSMPCPVCNDERHRVDFTKVTMGVGFLIVPRGDDGRFCRWGLSDVPLVVKARLGIAADAQTGHAECGFAWFGGEPVRTERWVANGHETGRSYHR